MFVSAQTPPWIDITIRGRYARFERHLRCSVRSVRSSIARRGAFLPNPVGISEAAASIARISAVRPLLQVICEITGAQFAAVTFVTGDAWYACQVNDEIGIGIAPGDELKFFGVPQLAEQAARASVLVDDVDVDTVYGGALRKSPYGIRSLISVPIVLAQHEGFGTLCAFSRQPANVSDPRVASMLTRFAALIAAQIEQLRVSLQERSAMLDERAAGELREQFIAILGHDLRNPLHAIYSGADLLERKLVYPAHSDIAARIKTSARRMSGLIDDVLDFARGRLGGGIEVEFSEHEDVSAALTSVVQELRDAQRDCEIQATIVLTGAVRCDLGRLQQVASNLLANALTHGLPDAPIKLYVHEQADELVLQVWNAGEAIAADNLGKIFEPFWRRTVSASRNGLGLGLHICAQIVRAHNGRISVTSDATAGTLFTVRLPLKQSDASLGAAPLAGRAAARA